MTQKQPITQLPKEPPDNTPPPPPSSESTDHTRASLIAKFGRDVVDTGARLVKASSAQSDPETSLQLLWFTLGAWTVESFARRLQDPRVSKSDLARVGGALHKTVKTIESALDALVTLHTDLPESAQTKGDLWPFFADHFREEIGKR